VAAQLVASRVVLSSTVSRAGSVALTAVVMSVAVHPYVYRRFGGKYQLHLQGRKSGDQETSVEPVARRCVPSPSKEMTVRFCKVSLDSSGEEPRSDSRQADR
jgi:hypothetical protein